MSFRTEPNGLQACCVVQALIRDAGEQGAQGSPGLPYSEFASRSVFSCADIDYPAGARIALAIFSLAVRKGSP